MTKRSRKNNTKRKYTRRNSRGTANRRRYKRYKRNILKRRETSHKRYSKRKGGGRRTTKRNKKTTFRGGSSEDEMLSSQVYIYAGVSGWKTRWIKYGPSGWYISNNKEENPQPRETFKHDNVVSAIHSIGSNPGKNDYHLRLMVGMRMDLTEPFKHTHESADMLMNMKFNDMDTRDMFAQAFQGNLAKFMERSWGEEVAAAEKFKLEKEEEENIRVKNRLSAAAEISPREAELYE